MEEPKLYERKETNEDKLGVFLSDIFKSPLKGRTSRYNQNLELRKDIKFNSISGTGHVLDMSDNPRIVDEETGVLAKGTFQVENINQVGDKPDSSVIMFDLKFNNNLDEPIVVTGTLINDALKRYQDYVTPNDKITEEFDSSPNRNVGEVHQS